MTRYIPNDLIPWATDATYPAGADPWSGQPNKVKPSGALHATGLIPETRYVFPYHNWLQSKLTDAAIVQVHTALRHWRAFTVNSSPAADAGVGGYIDSLVTGDIATAAIGGYLVDSTWAAPDVVLVAMSENVGADYSIKFGSDCGHWSAGTTVSGITKAFSFASLNGDYGDRLVMASSADRDVTRSTDSMNSQSTASNVVPVSHGVGCLHMSGNGSKRLLLGVYGVTSNTQRIYTSDDGGATWTPRNTPAGFNTQHIYNFADNGAGVIIATGYSISNSILRSSDNGTTWTAETFPGGTGPWGVAYSAALGLFAIAPDLAGFQTSPDGLTWTAHIYPPFGTAPADPRSRLAACGPVFAHVFNTLLPGNATKIRRGIWYTLDAGDNWHRVVLGNFASSREMQGVRAVGNRLVAWDWQTVYLSEPLFAYDAIDFTP